MSHKSIISQPLRMELQVQVFRRAYVTKHMKSIGYKSLNNTFVTTSYKYVNANSSSLHKSLMCSFIR